jgi:hypothetical protein
MIILSPHVGCHLFLMNKSVYCQSDKVSKDASKSENSAVNQKMFQPVDQHRWGDASKGKIRKLIEKKSPKKCRIEYYQTDRWFKIFDF